MPPRMYRTLSYEFTPPVVVIRLRRPRASNRVNLALASELRQACQQLAEEDGARVAVITGAGKVFSSGREPLSPSPKEGPYTPSQWLELHRGASSLAGVGIPIIAAINGDATDQGLELALACDLRVAARGARLGFSRPFAGTVPWDGGTQRLPRLVGRALALEMLLMGRLMGAAEARSVGLVNMVVEHEGLMSTVEETAREIAEGAPIAARYVKEAVLKGMDLNLDQGLRLEADLSILLHSTSDRAEGLRSFLEKRQPRFKGE